MREKVEIVVLRFNYYTPSLNEKYCFLLLKHLWFSQTLQNIELDSKE